MTAPITLEEWRGYSREDRRALWTNWSQDQRSEMYGLLAANTPNWGLPYPVDYNDPADSPTVLRDLALATDTALTNAATLAAIASMPRALTPHAIACSSGWGGAPPIVYKSGQVCWLSGVFLRTSDIHVEDNVGIRLGTLPPEGWPKVSERTAGPWPQYPDDGGPVNYTVGHLFLGATEGEVVFTPNGSGTIRANGWVTIGGFSYVAQTMSE